MSANHPWYTRILEPFGHFMVRPQNIAKLRFLPFRRPAVDPAVWDEHGDRPLPEGLRGGSVGITRNPEAEEKAFAAGPLPEFGKRHARAIQWAHHEMWQSWLFSGPRLMRAFRKVAQAPRAAAREQRTLDDPAVLTEEFRRAAREAGISAVGVTTHDEKYTWETQLDTAVGDRMVVCVLEQPWEETQSAPSVVSERKALDTYTALMHKALELGEFLRECGYAAHVNDIRGSSATLHYAVNAGLGQLGLNGQVLTPQAGSRCRMLLINTDAPLVLDQPRDYGIEKVCDACRACVVRCPSGAIPDTRSEHRGVVKAKLNTKRCLPVVAQTEGCAVCMKVCPVQRYGLDAVLDQYEEDGTIMGRGTDELEGYVWPLDGVRYGPGERPRLDRAFFERMGDRFDPNAGSGDDVAFL